MKKINFCLCIALGLLLTGQVGAAQEKPTAQDWFQKGVAAETQGIHEEAIKMYTEAIALDSSYAEAYFKRGKVYRAYDLTSPKEAMADFDATVSLAPANAEAYYERGLLNAFLLNNENAAKDMKTAATLGHEGARKWLASAKEKAVAVATGEEESPQTAATEKVEKVNGMESKPITLRELLPSGSEPVVFFDFNMATLRESDLNVLADIALLLQNKLPEANLIISGYTDDIGPEKYNEGLSLQRAQAVESYLFQELGIPHSRITVKGYGEQEPLATNKTQEGRAKNRRAKILLGPAK